MKSFSFHEIEVGHTESFSHSFSVSDIDTFAQLSGDHSPIHMDAAAAKARGFSQRVVHGLLTGSLLSRLVGVYLPGTKALFHKMDIAFVNPVFAEEKLQVTGTVVGKQDAYKQLEIKVRMEKEDGQVVLRGKIWAGVSE